MDRLTAPDHFTPAQRLGFMAQRAGMSEDDNPYQTTDGNRSAWRKGWLYGSYTPDAGQPPCEFRSRNAEHKGTFGRIIERQY